MHDYILVHNEHIHGSVPLGHRHGVYGYSLVEYVNGSVPLGHRVCKIIIWYSVYMDLYPWGTGF